MTDNSTYISIDVEATGPIPGVFSMISLGAAAYDSDGNCLDTFEVNIEELPDALRDASTMEFWAHNKEAWDYATQDPQDPHKAIEAFAVWLESFNKPTAVAYPAGFDFTHVFWYLHKFAKRSPLSFSCLDIKSYAAALLNIPYRRVTKNDMPDSWFSSRPHTHKALDDALEQGDLFFNMRKANDIKR